MGGDGNLKKTGCKGKSKLDKEIKREKLNYKRGQGGSSKDANGTRKVQTAKGKSDGRLNNRQLQGVAFQKKGVDSRQEETGSKVWDRVGEGIRAKWGGDSNRQQLCRGRTSCKVGLKCFYANARSLRNKKDELFSYIVDEDLDVICITEAWINEEKFKESKRSMSLMGTLCI